MSRRFHMRSADSTGSSTGANRTSTATSGICIANSTARIFGFGMSPISTSLSGTNDRTDGYPCAFGLSFSDGFPHIRFVLWSGGGVHVDIPVEVQIELFENRDQGFHVIVRGFTGIHREVALKQDLFLGNIGDHQPV